MTIAALLARFAATTRYEDIPPPVARYARYLMLDAVGVALASSRFEFAQRAALALRGLGEGTHPVIGMPLKLALRDAALLNGTLVHGLDFDDTYLPGSMHLSASAVPCALLVGAAAAASGRDVLTALAIGMEASARIAAAGVGLFQQAGFHPTGVVGAFGCSLITTRLWQMSADQMVLAQGIALSTAAGSVQPMQDGTWTKRMHPGWAAASAITAAAFARQGYLSPQASYEGRFGLYQMFLGAHAAKANTALVTDQLGTQGEFARTTIKLFPACHHVHAFMNAAIRIANEPAFAAGNVQSITAVIAKECIPLVCEPVATKCAPPDGYTAQFSLQYTVACSLLRRGFGLADLEEARLKDPATLALAAKVGFEIDPNPGFPKSRSGELVIRLHDGTVLQRRENIMPDEPIAEEDIEAKFFRNAEMVLTRSRAESIQAAILHLEDEPDVRRITQLLAQQ